MEKWAITPENDAYEVSDLGRVRRVKPGSATTPGRIVKPMIHGQGYPRVRLHPERVKHYSVHRLVWSAFVGPIPDGLVINHKNGIKQDNRLENLEVCTRLQNTHHAIATGLFKPTVAGAGCSPKHGEDNPSAKLTERTVRQIRALRQQGISCPAIATRLGLAKRAVQYVAAGKYWASVD